MWIHRIIGRFRCLVHLVNLLILRYLRAYWTSFKIDTQVINSTSLVITLVDSCEDLQNPHCLYIISRKALGPI